MSAEAIAAIEALQTSGAAATAALEAGQAQAGNAFGTAVSQGLAQVNGQLLASSEQVQALATGNVENLHQVMMRLEEAGLTFQLFMQVRNRVLEAYQEVMRMQV